MITAIIARYKEDISWTKDLRPDIQTVIYNKFHQDEKFVLPNIGREGHTYLNHIVNNYDNLSEYNIFLQGNPVFHNRNIISTINSFDYSSYLLTFLGDPISENIYSIECPPHPCGLPMYYFFDLLFDIKLTKHNKIRFVPGAQFIAHKEIILNRPKNFYQFLLKFLSYQVDPLEGYIIERLWAYIFDPNISLSQKYELFI